MLLLGFLIDANASLSKAVISLIIIIFYIHFTGIKTKNSYTFGDQYVHFNVSIPT